MSDQILIGLTQKMSIMKFLHQLLNAKDYKIVIEYQERLFQY